MHVEMRDIGTIKPYPHNPRHNDQAVAAVAASIREFGFRPSWPNGCTWSGNRRCGTMSPPRS